jgi:hypothetical protein
VPGIARQILDEAGAADVVTFFLELQQAAETPARRAFSLRFAHAGSHQVAFE